MPSKSGYTEAPPRYGGDRFYNPPLFPPFQDVIYHHRFWQSQLAQQQHQHQQQQQHINYQHQQQRQRHWRAMAKPESSMEARRRDGGDVLNAVALSAPRSVSSAPAFEATNLDRLMESVSPFIQPQYLSEVNKRGSRMHPFFYLEDLWESFAEQSAYGVGVPLLLHGTEPTNQYYVPFLSGIQLYVDQSTSSSRLRVPNKENDAMLYRLTSSVGTCDFEGDRRAKPIMRSNMQQSDKLPLGDKSLISSSNSETDIAKLEPVFSFLESESPHYRKPLAEKILELSKEYPDLVKLRSCDLLPTSWICVAWYPIYRIPMGSTLRDLDASFLSFHSLSTHPRTNSPPKFHAPNTRIVKGFIDPAPKISLPVFALAAYKLKGSIVSPCGPHEREQEKSLEQAADNWLSGLKVMLPDYNFFRTHSHPMR